MSLITKKQSTMIFPSGETPNKSLWLSSLDLMVVPPFRHASAVFVYQPHKESDTPSSKFFDPNILKDSLSKVLVPFYPMAGRLKKNDRENGRLEIDCNPNGALFVEAETRLTVEDFGDFTPDGEFKKLLVPSCDYSKGISSFPLLMVQLTRFKCGAVALGFAQHHQVGDGQAHLHFINSWARIARGLDLTHLPCFDRTPHLAPRHPPQLSFDHFDSEYGPPQGILGDSSQLKLLETAPTLVSVLKLTKAEIDALKAKTRTSEKLSTYTVLAAHVWRCACKARGLDENQEVRLFIPTDGRSRLKKPALPNAFFANVMFYPACIAKAGEITSKPLLHAATKIRETLMRANDEEYLRSTIDYLESHPDIESLVRGPHKIMCPNLNVNSWARLPFDESDFGWGKPGFTGHGGIGYEGQAFIVRSNNGDGSISVAIKLFTMHMTIFKDNFYDF